MPSSGVQTCADRKSTRLNSSHTIISYAVFCLKKKTQSEIVAGSQAAVGRRNAQAPSVVAGAAGGRVRGGQAAGHRAVPEGDCYFFFNDTATTEIYTLSLHDALPI